MSVLGNLLACAGEWRGSSRLEVPPMNIAEESPSTATVTPLLGGRFVRMDYTWKFGEEDQQGSLLIGHQAESGTVTAHWIDSWHMGNQVMACRGTAGPDGEIVVRGSYGAPTGPDWGWRTVITPGDRLRMVMFNVTPEGEEALAVEARYTRT